MFSALKDLFCPKIKKLGLAQEIQKKKIFNEWEDIVVEVFDKKFRKKSEPLFIKNKTLFVDCFNSVWAAEFQASSHWLLEKIRQRFGKKIITDIRFIS